MTDIHGEPLRLGIVPLRPLVLSDLVTGAWQAVRRNPGPLLLLPLAVIAVAQALAWLLIVLVLGEYPELTFATPPVEPGTDPAVLDRFWEELRLLGIAGGLQLVVIALLGMVATAVVNVVVPRAVFGHTTSTGEAVRPALAAVPRLLGTTALTALLLGLPFAVVAALVLVLGPVGVLLVLVAGPLMLYLSIALTFAQAVVVVEDASPVAALRRSRELVHAVGWWRALGVSMLVSLFFSFVTLIVQTLFEQVSGGGVLAALLASTLVGAVNIGFGASVLCLLYVDHRARWEGIEGLWNKAG
ncbi:hypothetical protein [Actinokineospora pegani]|uniref:hypothetical protein n=1 Tax=Actinokineospora pegani TaxID=2654637 RepID=UPI0012EAD159|nr:hypothetical protein [Actinokineospora pegani]